VAKLLGIDLMTNFLYPYFVTNPRDFWRNWHISLSTWLRDYLYIPLGGNRGSRLATYRNLMLTMLLGGLWHGAAWTFVAWGAFHGLLLAGHRAASENGWLGRREGISSPVKKGLAVLLMFHLTCLGWLIFRAESFGQLVHLVGSLATRMLEWTPRAEYFLVSTLFFVIPVVLVQLMQRHSGPNLLRAPLGEWRRAAVACSMIVALFAWGEFGGREFVYFQF
jgi:D-alanyl-lipoteichoic acid acyltransferase DltB (MBOAT superfamily)